ncbi:methyltransferase [Gordonia phage Easley]|uniref:Methyltransferase n=1 Tax=Gordonia phage Easley TaxID=2182395 RepID=A0A2U8UMU5_9CAUD|nr:methyltransferase [Gordonia phage Easley]AWN05064.1 methyltransferase [Gordonia phage Easley]
MVADSDPSKWVMAGHTQAKHEILKKYLAAWFPIISSNRGRVVYIDGFAGRGRYDDGSEGSPQLALRTLLEHNALATRANCEFLFMFIEKNRSNAEALEAELEAMEAGWPDWPENVKWGVFNASFDDHMEELFQVMRDQNKQLAPTFAFVDPFGYTRFPMDVLAQLGKTPNSELFINFMVGFVQRFVGREGQEKPVRELYGMAVEEVMENYLAGKDRIEHLVEVYMDALKSKADFSYAQRFYMINHTGNVSYALVHVTNEPLGVKKMKAAMWGADPSGQYRYSDRMGSTPVLFVPDPDLGPLKGSLLREFAGESGVTGEQVRWHAILRTPFRETHATVAMRELEKAGEIEVHRPPGKRQFAAGVTLSFPAVS